MRKTTLLAVIAVGALSAGAALAQDVTSPAPPPVAAEPPPAPAPADPAAAPAPAPTPQAAPAAPGEAAPAAPAYSNVINPLVAEPAPPPPPPPPPPTDPTTIAILNALQRICMPAARGETVEALSEPLGYREHRRTGNYVYRIDRSYEIRIRPQGTNQNVCSLEIDYPIGQIEPIVVGVHNWAIAGGYTLYRNDEFTTDLKRHTRSWERTEDGETEALVLVSVKKPDGSPMDRRADLATVLYSVTPAPEQ